MRTGFYGDNYKGCCCLSDTLKVKTWLTITNLDLGSKNTPTVIVLPTNLLSDDHDSHGYDIIRSYD